MRNVISKSSDLSLYLFIFFKSKFKRKALAVLQLRAIKTTIHRGSRPEVFCKKGVLENFAKFTGLQLY